MGVSFIYLLIGGYSITNLRQCDNWATILVISKLLLLVGYFYNLVPCHGELTILQVEPCDKL